MRIPFTTAEFFDTMRRYNEAVWPAQWVLYALALALVILALRGGPRASRVIAGGLALLWLWMGVVYHLAFFRLVNTAATLFGVAFVAQAALFLWAGARPAGLPFRARRGLRGAVGGGMLAYALAMYPLIGYALGHRFPEAPTFGLPCPTTVFTFGLLLWAAPPVPRALLVVPVLWAIVATQGALLFGVWQDLGLTLTAAVAVALLWPGGRRLAVTPRARTA